LSVIHPTADIERGAQIGADSRIWHFVHVRTGAVIGANCTLGYNVYIDKDVVIGDNVKLQNRVSVYRGVTLEDGVFVGPHATFTNDQYPRSITPNGELQDHDDWPAVPTLVRYGASIGAASVVIAGVTVGRWAMVGAGSIVTHDVPDHGLVIGRPARLVGYACACGHTLRSEGDGWTCPECSERYELPPLNEASR
jgi:UDP-2-acetamido-3-amino-2,3-dideoxy-glucuronate N-acetyltransferase